MSSGAATRALFWPVALAGLLVPALLCDLKIPDEPRVAHTSEEMFRTGDLVLPAVNGKPFLQTPPFHYWILGAWLRAFGTEPDGMAHVPSVLFSAGTLVLTALIARKHLRGRAELHAFLAAAVLAGTIGFWDAGQRTVTDTSLAFFTTLGFYHLAAVLVEGDVSARRGAWLGASAGLAFLSKGLPGPAILGSVGLAAFLATAGPCWRGVLPPTLRILRFAAALTGVFIAVSVPWVAALWLRDPAYVDDLLFQHVKARFLEGAHHDPSNFAFIHRALLKLLPWGVVLPFAIAGFARRTWGKDQGAQLVVDRRSRAFSGLVAAWVLIPVLLLLLSRSKRNLYLLPVFPGLALALSAWLAGWLERGPPARIARWIPRMAWVSVVLLPICGTLYYQSERAETSFADFGRALEALEKGGRTVTGLLLDEREEGAIAWYLHHPFDNLGDPGAFLERMAALPAGALAVVEAGDLRVLRSVPGGDILSSVRVVLERDSRRRRLQVLERGGN